MQVQMAGYMQTIYYDTREASLIIFAEILAVEALSTDDNESSIWMARSAVQSVRYFIALPQIHSAESRSEVCSNL